jgi:predicted alpha/beta hydrolase family esterase
MDEIGAITRARLKRQLLFVQGGGARVHDAWDNKLVESLKRELGPGYEIRYPRMPDESDPSYEPWRAMLQKEFATLHDGAIVVGHSIGGTILINALAQQPPARELGGIFLLAAPFVGEGGWPADDWQPQRGLGAKISAGVPVYVFHGLADDTAPPAHAELYARAIPQAHLCRLPGRDHQLNNDLREVAAAIKALAAEHS